MCFLVCSFFGGVSCCATALTGSVLPSSFVIFMTALGRKRYCQNLNVPSWYLCRGSFWWIFFNRKPSIARPFSLGMHNDQCSHFSDTDVDDLLAFWQCMDPPHRLVQRSPYEAWIFRSKVCPLLVFCRLRGTCNRLVGGEEVLLGHSASETLCDEVLGLDRTRSTEVLP